MSNDSGHKKRREGRTNCILAALSIGVLGGAVTMGLLLALAAPGMLIVTHESQLGHDKTVAALTGAIVERGWTVSGISGMNKDMADQGAFFSPRVNTGPMGRLFGGNRGKVINQFVTPDEQAILRTVIK